MMNQTVTDIGSIRADRCR